MSVENSVTCENNFSTAVSRQIEARRAGRRKKAIIPYLTEPKGSSNQGLAHRKYGFLFAILGCWLALALASPASAYSAAYGGGLAGAFERPQAASEQSGSECFAEELGRPAPASVLPGAHRGALNLNRFFEFIGAHGDQFFHENKTRTNPVESPAAMGSGLIAPFAAPESSVHAHQKAGRGLMATFEHVRISLARQEPPPIVKHLGEPDPKPRRQYLIEAFSIKRNFINGQNRFTFLPMRAPSGYLAGFFGRAVKKRGKKGPDQSYVPETLETNDAALFILDLADDSQIAVMEHKNDVGSPKAILTAFMNAVKRTDGFRDYEPHVKYISTEDTYWSVVEAYRGQITEIDFTFIPPNALKSEETVAEFIKQASQQAHSETLEHSYRNKHGKLNPKAPIIAGSVNVALKGGGEAVVRSGHKVIFRSSESKKTTDVPSEEVPKSAEESSLLRGFINRWFSWGDKQ